MYQSAEIEGDRRPKKKSKIIYQRNMKSFEEKDWRNCLARKKWEKLAKTESIQQMTQGFT